MIKCNVQHNKTLVFHILKSNEIERWHFCHKAKVLKNQYQNSGGR